LAREAESVVIVVVRELLSDRPAEMMGSGLVGVNWLRMIDTDGSGS
jgi:hypothetical protein